MWMLPFGVVNATAPQGFLATEACVVNNVRLYCYILFMSVWGFTLLVHVVRALTATARQAFETANPARSILGSHALC
jgi:hypothetical protein